MKKALLTIGILFLTVVLLTAQDITPLKVGGAEITFEKETHDYGKIKQHADGVCEFKFKNTGTEPLLISDSKGSCGCTVPTWPREPIAPGASATIKVKYATDRIGAINKSVTIQSNAVNEPTKIIRIKGEVLAPDASATPIKPTEGPVQH